MKVHWFGWVLSAALLTVSGGCGSESGGAPSSLAELGIDDGASAGISTSALVTKDRDAEIALDTGAGVKIPKGAVEDDIELSLKRPADKEALALIKGVDKKQSVVSAPYVVTPHGTKFKADVELTLPIGKSAASRKLKVLWLEDENDRTWKELGVPEVSGDKATVKLSHFSVLVLVEDDGTTGDVDGPRDTDDSGSAREDIDAGPGTDDVEAGSVEAEAGPSSGRADAGGDEEPMRRPGDVVLSALPVDLAADCPASGCTIRLNRMDDGTWVDCPVQSEAASFDPETFDFAELCAGAQQRSTDLRFVHEGVAKYWDSELGTCGTSSVALDGMGKMLESECGDYYSWVEIEENVRAQDGALYDYDYDDCDGSCSPSLYVSVFRPGDTSQLNAGCSAEPEQIGSACTVTGVVLPFGPSGVGTLPQALVGTTWLRCDGNGADPASECSSEVAEPLADGSMSLLRFNADGTADGLGYDESEGGWSATCGVRAGGDATRLRLFWCADPSNPDEWGAENPPWELQRIGTRDYLLLTESTDVGDVDVYVSAPTGLLPGSDPCDGTLPQVCVLR